MKTFSRDFFVRTGKRGGSVKSKEKAESSRENGKLGGRPPSFKKGDELFLNTGFHQEPVIFHKYRTRGPDAYAIVLIGSGLEPLNVSVKFLKRRK